RRQNHPNSESGLRQQSCIGCERHHSRRHQERRIGAVVASPSLPRSEANGLPHSNHWFRRCQWFPEPLTRSSKNLQRFRRNGPKERLVLQPTHFCQPPFEIRAIPWKRLHRENIDIDDDRYTFHSSILGNLKSPCEIDSVIMPW